MDADLLQYLEGMEKRRCERFAELMHGIGKHLGGQIDERMHGTSESLREHFDGRVAGVGKSLRDHIDRRWHEAETRILRAFEACHEITNARVLKIEADISNINESTSQQLNAMQSKLLDLETRVINLEGPQGRTA
jgi:hypothetical protein